MIVQTRCDCMPSPKSYKFPASKVNVFHGLLCRKQTDL